jgi:hypothetical protein
MVATVRQHGCMTLAPEVSGRAVQRIRQTKDAERRDKMSMRTGEGTRPGKGLSTFQKAGDAKNGTDGL